MSKIVIIGGKLQGCEAAYLGKEAGIDVILIDSSPDAPAQKLCSEFICADVLSDDERVAEALESADMILPTMENDAVLKGLTELSEKKGYTLAFDWDAYRITSSKTKSDKLFADNGLPCPRYYPAGEAPYIAKPESESGSHGVIRFESREAVERYLKEGGRNAVIQEFVEGPSYSVEIIGMPGNYRTYEPTRIFVDDVYDCNYAAAYRDLPQETITELSRLAEEIAELIGLHGIMDLEVIDNGSELKVLEIDARLPSQTSIVVYHASGMNYIKELYDIFVNGRFCSEQTNKGHCASLTHYLFSDGKFSSHGEHIMVEGSILEYTGGICSRAEVLSDRENSSGKAWRGTFINHAPSYEQLMADEEVMKDELAYAAEQTRNQEAVMPGQEAAIREQEEEICKTRIFRSLAAADASVLTNPAVLTDVI